MGGSRGLLMLVTMFAFSSVDALGQIASGQITYPASRRVEQVDRFHGVEVADPYRWMETDARQSEEIANWIAAQNELTRQVLDAPARREAIRARLQELIDFERYSPPIKAGGRYAYLRNDGLQNHAVLYVVDTLDGTPRVLIDPNTWSADGSLALAGFEFSPSGKYVAYGVSASGSDWQTWHVMVVASGKVLEGKLEWLKATAAAWTKDEAGFFYARFPAPPPGAEYQAHNKNQEVCYHKVGTPQSEDKVVYRRPEEPDWCFDVHTSDDGHFAVIKIRKADDERFRLVYQDLTSAGADWVDLVDNFDHLYYFVNNDGPWLYFITTQGAPQRRLVAIDTRRPAVADWKEIIPEANELLDSATMVGGRLLAVSLRDASTRVRVYSLSGQPQGEVSLPGIGTAEGFGGRVSDTETFYAFSSFIQPATIYRYQINTGNSSVFRQPKLKFNPNDYQVEQVFIPSKDGTRVPLFISHKKGLPRDGANPTLLYGYGGFNISLTPRFAVGPLAWMEMGGVYVMANLRGGGEYGEAWHQAGTKTHKQNVFDDFIAAAEWLIANKYTRSDRLAIQGGSNGGLLVAAVLVQRPDLFGACIADVPVTDMLRFQHFTDGRFWTTDYGSIDNPEEFRALLAYSPYHNVKPGTDYPPTLVTTADTDDRVVPSNSFKFVAELQRAQAGPAPILLRVAVKAGHGAGKPTAQRIEELTDQFLFLTKALKVGNRG